MGIGDWAQSPIPIQIYIYNYISIELKLLNFFNISK